MVTVHGLPTVWPDLSMIGSDNMRKLIGHDLHVHSDQGTQAPVLQLELQHVKASEPGHYSEVVPDRSAKQTPRGRVACPVLQG